MYREPGIAQNTAGEQRKHEADENDLNPKEQLQDGLSSKEPMEGSKEYKRREMEAMYGDCKI